MADLSSQAKQAHLNIKGYSFIALHKLLDELYEAAAGHTDTLAERAISLGAQIHATVRAAASTSVLKEFPLEETAETPIVVNIAVQVATVSKLLYEAMNNSCCDLATQDVYIEQARDLDKFLYFLQSHIPMGWMLDATGEMSEENASPVDPIYPAPPQL